MSGAILLLLCLEWHHCCDSKVVTIGKVLVFSLMSIVYALIARNTVVLAEYTSSMGNFPVSWVSPVT